MINKYCVYWVQGNFFLASSNVKRKSPRRENVIKTRSRCIASLACRDDDISIETVREIAYIAFARRFVREIKIELYRGESTHTKKGAKGSALCDLEPTCLSFLFFFLYSKKKSKIDQERPRRDLERNHFSSRTRASKRIAERKRKVR